MLNKKKEHMVKFLSLDKGNRIKIFSVDSIFVNYFLLITVSELFLIFANKSTIINVGLPLVIFILSYRSYSVKKKNIIDILWYLSMFWIVFTWIINSFPHQMTLIFYSFFGQIAYMLAYWIGRCSKKQYLEEIIRKSYFPLLVTCTIGIYCYISPPSWYSARMSDMLSSMGADVTNTSQILELTRLKSIFGTTYTLAYFTSIVLAYNFFKMLTKQKEVTIWNYILVVVLIVTSLLCMMRAPIACWMISFMLACYYAFHYYKSFAGVKIIVSFLLLLILVIPFIYDYLDVSQISFITEKANSVSENNFIKDRLYLMGVNESLFGEGVGKYSLRAHSNFGMRFMPDGEYMKILAEQGYIGLVITILLFGVGLIKSIKHFRHLYMEMFLLLMVFICMVGANPLSTPDKHCFLYWLALGQISKYNKWK